MTIEIHLPCGRCALIDSEDEAAVSLHEWRSKGSEEDRVNGLYVVSTRGLGLHRLIMAAPPRVQVDHINHNGLDNRRANLRLCTPQENSRNRRMSRNNKAGFKGVCANKKGFQASIHLNARARHLGLFKNRFEAALAYDDAARAEFGDFAHLNFDPKRDWIIAGRSVGLQAHDGSANV